MIMTTRSTRPALAAFAAVVVLGLATGCSAAAPEAGDAESDELLATAQRWADAEPEAQLEALQRDADAVISTAFYSGTDVGAVPAGAPLNAAR